MKLESMVLRLTAAYTQGFFAFKYRHHLWNKNPYFTLPGELALHRAWEKGWEDAKNGVPL